MHARCGSDSKSRRGLPHELWGSTLRRKGRVRVEWLGGREKRLWGECGDERSRRPSSWLGRPRLHCEAAE